MLRISREHGRGQRVDRQNVERESKSSLGLGRRTRNQLHALGSMQGSASTRIVQGAPANETP